MSKKTSSSSDSHSFALYDHDNDNDNDDNSTIDNGLKLRNPSTKNANSKHKKPQQVSKGKTPVKDGHKINENIIESTSDSESGEDSWDDISVSAKSKNKKNSAQQNPDNSTWCWTITKLIGILLIIGLIILMFYLRFNDDSIDLEQSGFSQDLSKPPSIDYYKLLELPRTADSSQISKHYRKLAILYHPDKNKECASNPECKEKFNLINEAYQTLSNNDKRKQYDTVETSYDELISQAIDLTSENFNSLVLESNSVWIIQIYTEWHKSCIAFAPMFEEIILKYQNKVKFGRIHAYNQRQLVSTLPVSIRVVPTVLIIYDGEVKKSKSYVGNTRDSLLGLQRFLETEFPNHITLLEPNTNSINQFLTQNNAEFNVILFPSSVKDSNKPSLTLQSIAREFYGIVNFGQSLLPNNEKQYKQYLDSLIQLYGKIPKNKFPAVIYHNKQSNTTEWIQGELKDEIKNKLIIIMKQNIIKMNSIYYNELNNQFLTNSIFYITCNNTDSNNNKQNLESFTNIAKEQIHKQIQSQSSSNSAKSLNFIQFGVINSNIDSDFNQLCKKLNIKQDEILALIQEESNQFIYQYDINKNSLNTLKHFIQTIQDSDFKELINEYKRFDSIQVPITRIDKDLVNVKIPIIGTEFTVSSKYLYLAGLITGCILFSPLIANHFTTFVFLIFLSSFIYPAFEFIQMIFSAK